MSILVTSNNGRIHLTERRTELHPSSKKNRSEKAKKKIQVMFVNFVMDSGYLRRSRLKTISPVLFAVRFSRSKFCGSCYALCLLAMVFIVFVQDASWVISKLSEVDDIEPV